MLPAEWVEELNAAVAANDNSKIPQSNLTNNTIIYPNDTNLADVCSGSYKCRIPGDIWDAPQNIFASSFDDGPTDVSCFNFFFCYIFVWVKLTII